MSPFYCAPGPSAAPLSFIQPAAWALPRPTCAKPGMPAADTSPLPPPAAPGRRALARRRRYVPAGFPRRLLGPGRGGRRLRLASARDPGTALPGRPVRPPSADLCGRRCLGASGARAGAASGPCSEPAVLPSASARLEAAPAASLLPRAPPRPPKPSAAPLSFIQPAA